MHHCIFLVVETQSFLDLDYGFRELNVNFFFHIAVECDLLLAFVLIKNALREVVILTSGHVSRSSRLESSFHGEPVAPAVGCAAGNVEVLFYPCRESPVGVGEVIASALSAELLAEVVEQRSQVLLR